MKPFIVLLLSVLSCSAQFGFQAAVTRSTWEPRNLKTKAGLICYYNPDNAPSVVMNGSGVAAMSNLVSSTATMIQGTAAYQPTLPGTIGGCKYAYYNGTNYNLKTPTFTLNQPFELYGLFKPINWKDGRFLWDGYDLTHRASVLCKTTIPEMIIYASTYGPSDNNDFTVNNWHVITVKFDDVNSYIKHNEGIAYVGTPGNVAAAGLVIGGKYDGTSNFEMDMARMLVCNVTNALAEWSYLSWGLLKQAALH